VVDARNTDVWERLAPWWDQLMGEAGDEFHRVVVRPTVLDLLDLRPGQRVLEIGCGNGGFARQLAELGAGVVAIDQAEAFIRSARSRPGPPVDFRVVDATDSGQLSRLGPDSYDAAVANMVLMDMPEVETLYQSLMQLLRPGGRFVFAVIHPCFGTAESAPSREEDPDIRERLLARARKPIQAASGPIPVRTRQRLAEAVAAVRAVTASLRYLEARHMRVQAMPGQPVGHWYFHRPLSELLNPAFDAGLVLDHIAEPPYGGRELMASLLVVRLRRPDHSISPT
jgi:2-polyprenyl-3-methyl-5-hydroxy-6-metoxy-1,4-benzoquinol methylase